MPQATLFDQGYRGRIYQTHAVATDDFIKLGKEKSRGEVLAAGSMLVIDDIADTDPIKKVALSISAHTKDVRPEAGDVRRQHLRLGLILQRAIPPRFKGRRPGSEAFRNALRDAIGMRDVVGCQGVFNMSPTNHNGTGRARSRARDDQGTARFRLLPE